MLHLARESPDPVDVLRQRGKLALSALAALPDLLVAVLDGDGRCVLADTRALERHGYDAVQIEGRLAADFLPAGIYARWEPCFRAALGGRQAKYEHRSA